MTKKILLAVVAGIMTLIVILGAVVSESRKTPTEKFQEMTAYSEDISTKSANVFKENAIKILEQNGIFVGDSHLSACFIDGKPYITFTVLLNDGSELQQYSIETEYDGPIASAWGHSSDVISVYGDMLYIDTYFRYANYTLSGDEIVVK